MTPFVMDKKEVKFEITMDVPKTMDESVMRDEIERMFGRHNTLWMFVYRFKVQLTKGVQR